MFLYYNFIPTLAQHIIDFPLHRYPEGIKPKHNYPPFITQNIKKNDVIFVKSDLLPYFFQNIYPKISKKFYLLTGVAGLDISPRFMNYLNEDKIIKWVGCNIVWEHPKAFKIPIGFEETERRRGGPASGEGGDQLLLQELYESKKKFQEKENKLLITYIGNTHSTRSNVKNSFINRRFVHFADKMNFENYMRTIDKYRFVLCPRGCGTDTHRFWEVLLMGSIPVVEKDGLYDLYDKFPCIIVEAFNDVTEELLSNFTLQNSLEENIGTYLKLDNFSCLLTSIFSE